MEEPFHNRIIDTDMLPQLEVLEFVPIERKHLWIILTNWAFGALIPPAAFLAINIKLELDFAHWIALGWLGLFLVGLVDSLLSFRNMGYALREHDVNFRKGWFVKSITSIPFNRVQHCEVKQGPLENMLGLASLKVFTAGGAGSDMTIRGLAKEKAKDLRSYITSVAASKREY
jgi:uncharacterized protein